MEEFYISFIHKIFRLKILEYPWRWNRLGFSLCSGTARFLTRCRKEFKSESEIKFYLSREKDARTQIPGCMIRGWAWTRCHCLVRAPPPLPKPSVASPTECSHERCKSTCPGEHGQTRDCGDQSVLGFYMFQWEDGF